MDRMVMLGAECLMLDANIQFIARREKENTNIRIFQNSKAFLPRIKIRGVVVNA